MWKTPRPWPFFRANVLPLQTNEIDPKTPALKYYANFSVLTDFNVLTRFQVKSHNFEKCCGWSAHQCVNIRNNNVVYIDYIMLVNLDIVTIDLFFFYIAINTVIKIYV